MNHTDCFKKLQSLIDNPVFQQLARLNLENSFLVGGAIRNSLLDIKYNDFDIIVSGDFQKALSKIHESFYVQPHRINTRFNTARFALGDITLDVTQINDQGLDEDLNNRENTISAFALKIKNNLSESDLFYPEQALGDLENLILRMPTPGVMHKDPIRVLRVWRYAEEFGATINKSDLSEINTAADRLCDVSRERITEELWRALELPHASAILYNWHQYNILFNIFPELAPADGCEQNDYHHLDVLRHSLLAVQLFDQNLWRLENWGKEYHTEITSILNESINTVSKQAITRLALLLHDVGKPSALAVKNDRITFYEHDRIGAEIASNICDKLKFSSKQTELVIKLIKHHMRIGFLCEVEQITERILYRYWHALEDDGVLIILLNLADRLATQGKASTSENLKQHFIVSDQLLRKRFEKQKPIIKMPLNGDDIMKLTGLKPSSQVGKLLQMLHEAVSIGEITSLAQAEMFIKENANL